MGGESSQQQTQSSQTAPWAAAQPALQGLLGNLQGQIGNANLTGAETGALNTLQQNANAGNPFAGQINDYATNMLSGGGANAQAGNIQGGLDAFKTQMSPYADANYSSLNNPQLQAALQTIKDDVGQSINGQFAAAGRDMSGANQMAYGRGVTAAQAPLILDQFNKDQALRQNASRSLYDAQNQTGGLLAGLNQQSLANQQQGVTTSQDALAAQNYAPTQALQIESLRRGIPAQALGLLAQIGVPIAGLGSQSSGQASSTAQMSGADQFAKIAGGTSQLLGSFSGGGNGGGTNFAKFLFG